MSMTEPEPGPWSNFYDAGSRRLRVRLINEVVLGFEVWDRNVYGPHEEPDANIEIGGAVRFDGCANMSSTDDGCIHTCNLDDVANIARAIRGAYALAAVRLADYCGEVVPLELSEEVTA